MDPIPVSATELRTRARELIERVHYYHECYRVENFGRPMAVIISCQEFEELQALLKQHAPAPPAPHTRNEHSIAPAARAHKKI